MKLSIVSARKWCLFKVKVKGKWWSGWREKEEEGGGRRSKRFKMS